MTDRRPRDAAARPAPQIRISLCPRPAPAPDAAAREAADALRPINLSAEANTADLRRAPRPTKRSA